jgi:undecaprenyl-diphosphatase
MIRTLLLVLALLGPLEQLDLAAQRAVQDARRPELERSARFLSDIGKPGVVGGLLLVICLLEGASGVATARLAVLTLVPVNLVVEGLKRLTDRARPDGEHKRSNASFPSSHAANAFAIAAVLARHWRRAASALWALAVLIAGSRVYLNRHFTSDIAVGAAIGIMGAWAVHAQWERRRARSEARSSLPPG